MEKYDMKILIITTSLLISVLWCQTQIKGLTETGDEVMLNSDGTWHYITQQAKQLGSFSDIRTNPIRFYKDENASFLLKSKLLNVGVWIDPLKWNFNKSGLDEDSEYEFSRKGEDLYGIIITERIELPLNMLREIAIENMLEVASDAKITKEEFRYVNGTKVLLLKIAASMSGMSIFYYAYYFSSPNGSVQLLTYTSDNLFPFYKEEMEILLNGFVEIK